MDYLRTTSRVLYVHCVRDLFGFETREARNESVCGERRERKERRERRERRDRRVRRVKRVRRVRRIRRMRRVKRVKEDTWF